MTSSKQPGVEEELTALVEKFWLMEQVDAKTLFPTADEALCEEIFIKESRRDHTGRFVVRIPFKENVAELGDSNQAALRRFLLLEKRLRNNPVIEKMYNAFIEEYLALGHMALVPRDSREKVKYLAPHTFVLRPESTSTKLRVVFDCSCKTSSGLSLNDVMCKGPIVQDDLLAIVLRFRCYKYAITADVTKMYRQAWVSEEDSFYQCILWRPTPNEDIEVYRLLTITYGTASAPYLATRCVKALGEQCAEKFPYGANKVLSDFYMDDVISGADSDEQLQQIYSEVSEILSSAGFELRKWYSNNSEFLKKVPSDDQEKPLRMNDAEIIKTLGIIWEPTSDVFRYDWPELKMDKPVTKRIVLAEIASLFDPLGLINPIIVKAKIFLQNLWIIKVHWDESLPLEDNAQWIRFREKLPLVKDIRVPRYILAKNGPESNYTDFVMRRCGLMGHAYSEIVLNWLSKHPSEWSIFVANRVATIQEWTKHALWRHVPTKSNPADVISRGAYADELIETCWFTGPAFLRQTCDKWPPNRFRSDASEINIEQRRAVALPIEHRKNQVLLWLESHSNFGQIQRKVAYLLYFFRRKTNRETLVTSDDEPMLTAELLREAWVRIMYCIQQEYFEVEIKQLARGKELPPASKLKNLSVFLASSFGVSMMRVGGRLARSQLPYEAKFPIVLPPESLIVRTYIRHLHETNMHVAAQDKRVLRSKGHCTAPYTAALLTFWRLWEAAVKSAKYHLTRTLGNAHLTFEELCTITTEIEAILNSRPLCTCSADPNDEEVLTPAHFLVGSTPDVLAEPLLEPAKVSLRDQWQRLTVMKQHFWARWSKEYLQDMQRKAKWIKPQRNLAVGDLVLVAEDNAPPKHWMMGRVERVVPDEAGAVRVAEVRTKNGCIKRAIQKLARIPTEDEING
ncbi:uncharacterized protein LOC118741965 [Rhagoletis pomonella]|uniref:uncharacterized protein LOC118741965 n=1 Tax=Rhagoletis pomonella TaxID=28610 RepID=UPI0017870C9E|nr:uncharacterized protein LOC118741965 [Rhagoletis pomonella]